MLVHLLLVDIEAGPAGGDFACCLLGYRFFKHASPACSRVRQSCLALLRYGVVVALLAALGESMRDQVTVVDSEGFGEALNPLLRSLLLGWSVPESNSGVARLTHGPRGGRQTGRSIDGASVLEWPAVHGARGHDAIVSAYQVAVGRAAVP